ncbi:E3 ubiquitin-protein ligase RNF185-like isoform X2 [Anopheles funestus]|uniref:E3 ubiquitin-protein ligase RNF185-like isoform X2 n=1 Tax=Anopheles funestus TaxID=62324 RepID=UPI0020C6706B|nr:E3 ubiquitin-protein ligase RNF185-like isoform X2 [Anopheles funestus]XP_049298117.1 E3 ubiquitin-protein ligase RNF185-like isoform X2 [Anopheles funestus]
MSTTTFAPRRRWRNCPNSIGMASTTDIPPAVGTSPTAPLLEDLNEDTSSSSTSTASTTTTDSGKPSTSYSFSLIGSDGPGSSSSSSSTSYSTKRTLANESNDAGGSASNSKTKIQLENVTEESGGGGEGEGAAGPSSTDTGTGGEEEKKDDSMFECNICLDTAKDAVVSMCGHLFCWPCIHQWMNGYRNTCPVCKSSISKEKVIPLYGRGGSKEDPRKTVPPRPAGQRTEPEQPHGFQSFTGDGSFHMSFGIGAFPFGFFTSTLNFGDFRGAGNVTRENTREGEEDQFLSSVFLYVALIFLAWLAMA